MSQPTAVDWLIDQLSTMGYIYAPHYGKSIIDKTIKKAKQMEKEQMKESWFDSTLQFDNAASMVYKKEFEQYYNETYGQQQ